jgi:hypothetical protein
VVGGAVETYIMTEAAVGIYAIITHKLNVIQGLVTKGVANPFTLSLAFPAVFWVTFAAIIALQLLLLYFSPVPEAQPTLKWFARSAAPFDFTGLPYHMGHFHVKGLVGTMVVLLSRQQFTDLTTGLHGWPS